MLRTFLLLLLCYPLSNVYADSDTGWLSVGYFKEDGEEHSGVEISALAHTKKNLAGRVSGVIFADKEKGDTIEAYYGFSLTGYIHPYSNIINPYVGAGLYFGETSNCSGREEDRTCRESHKFAIYPEVGVAINVDKLHVYTFVRRYYDSIAQRNPENAIGTQIGIKF